MEHGHAGGAGHGGQRPGRGQVVLHGVARAQQPALDLQPGGGADGRQAQPFLAMAGDRLGRAGGQPHEAPAQRLGRVFRIDAGRELVHRLAQPAAARFPTRREVASTGASRGDQQALVVGRRSLSAASTSPRRNTGQKVRLGCGLSKVMAYSAPSGSSSRVSRRTSRPDPAHAPFDLALQHRS